VKLALSESNPPRYLSIGWRIMVVWGLGVALLGLLMSLLNHLVSPQILYYTSTDAQFTGVSWTQLQLLYPKLGSWLILFFDTTTSQLLFYGVLTAFVAATAYRRGERWAWISLLLAFIITFAHLIPTFLLLSRGVLANSGISIGVLGTLIMLAFLVVGLLLPGVELLKKGVVTTADRSKGSRKLSLSWILLLIFVGAANILFAIIVPLGDHLSYSTQAPITFAASDALFTGTSWQQIMSLSPALGLWIVLQMDNMCAGMMGGGILASAVAVKGFRYSKLWAWYAFLFALIVVLTPLYLVSIPFYQAGISAPGGVSLGLPPDPGFLFASLILTVVPVLALLLPIKHFRLSRTKVG
jgi:hypothetical protein